MSTLQFAETHNMIAFLEKPVKSNGFQEIINFLNVNQIHCALTVNPTIYTSCIEQFWVTAKAKTVNSECQLQALVDKKKASITETSIRIDLHLEDAGGNDCLLTATIFEELARMGYEKPSQRLTFYKAFFSPQWKFLIHTITQCLSAKTTTWNEFSSTMASAIICLATNQKFNLSKYIFDAMVLDLEKAKDTQAKEIAGLKKRVQKLERKKKSRTTGLKRLRKVGESKRVTSSEDKESLGAQEDGSKQGRIFKDFDKECEVSLVDETQGRLDDAKMFDTNDLHGDEVIMDMAVGEKQEQSAKVDERDVHTGVEDSVALVILVTTIAKPKAVTTATTRPKARGVVVQEPIEFKTTTSSPQASQPSKAKEKGKAIMIELEVPLKKKDQVSLDEEMVRNLEAQLQDKLIEEEKMARKKEEEANIALIASWENTEAMMKVDRLLAERLQTREQEELTDEEKAKLFMKFMKKRRKNFAALRHKKREIDLLPRHKREIKCLSILSIWKDESSSKKAEITQDSSTKRAGDKLESDKSKKQKTGENEEVKVDNEADLKMHMVIVKDDDIAIDAISLATKPPMIFEYKLIKEGIFGHYQLIRADGSSKRYRYSSMI
ncbi:hypothetical protein Tco_0266664 [Tanacetum coccineum]